MQKNFSNLWIFSLFKTWYSASAQASLIKTQNCSWFNWIIISISEDRNLLSPVYCEDHQIQVFRRIWIRKTGWWVERCSPSCLLDSIWWAESSGRSAAETNNTRRVLFKDPVQTCCKTNKNTLLELVDLTRWGVSYLRCGAGLAGPDQVGGVGQVNEQFLLRLQSWSRKIQQENLKWRECQSDEDLWGSPEGSSSDWTEEEDDSVHEPVVSVCDHRISSEVWWKGFQRV